MKELRATHELHDLRKSRNIGVAVALIAFVALMFGLSVVKVTQTGPIEGFDHVRRPALEVSDG